MSLIQREIAKILKQVDKIAKGGKEKYLDYYSLIDEKKKFRIIPIVGKSAKNNPSIFSSHIGEYDKGMDAHFIISKSENSKKLLVSKIK